MKRLYVLAALLIAAISAFFFFSRGNAQVVNPIPLKTLVEFTDFNPDTIFTEEIYNFNVKEIPKKGAILFLREAKEIRTYTTLDIKFKPQSNLKIEGIDFISIVLSSGLVYYKTSEGRIDRLSPKLIPSVNTILETIVKDLPKNSKIRTTRM